MTLAWPGPSVPAIWSEDRALHALWRSISSKKPYRMRAVAAREQSFVRASGCVIGEQ